MTTDFLIPVYFKVKWRLKSNHKYVWTDCKKLINIQTSKIIKKTTNGNGVKQGYFIDRKFIKIEDIISEKLIEKISIHDECPF